MRQDRVLQTSWRRAPIFTPVYRKFLSVLNLDRVKELLS